jgi:hypothetical protein
VSHLDDESLAALAIGDLDDPEASAHLTVCESCQSRMAGYTLLVEELAGAGGALPLVAPPARLLGDIREELELADPATSRELSRQGPRWLQVAAAAAVGILVGSVGLAALNFAQIDPGTLVASAPLSDLATEAPAGKAEVRQRADGAKVLVVDTDFVSVSDGYLEVWLIDESIEGMVSLGHLTGNHGEFVLPAGFDFAAFPIVDISVEPNDGVPTHSGASITRGVLAT